VKLASEKFRHGFHGLTRTKSDLVILKLFLILSRIKKSVFFGVFGGDNKTAEDTEEHLLKM